MTPASPTPSRDAAERPRRDHSLRSVVGLYSLLVVAAACLAWGLSVLLAGSGTWAAPLAAGVAVALAAVPSGAVLVKLLQRAQAQAEQLSQSAAAAADGGAGGRDQFLQLAEREWARARRYGGDPALLLVDVDRFHRLCETRGAGAGDAVLRQIFADVAPTLRGADAMARFGGSQLAVWLAQVDPIGALDVADRIRERTEALMVAWDPQALRVTVSVGVAALRPAHQSLASLVIDAEAAVQAARQAGGNCVRAAPVDLSRLRRIGPSVGDNQAAGPL